MTHDVIPASGHWLRVYPDNPELFHWKLIMSPETQVQVSGILVLENSIFLKVFIQACGEGEIVAVKARFCCAEGPSSLIPVLHHSLGHS